MSTALNRTVLAADLRGSIGLFENLGNASATSLVTRCVAELGAVVHAWGGSVFKTLGDGLMATFASGADACDCALQLHVQLRRLVERDTLGLGKAVGQPLRLRVVLATGEVIEQDGDYFGDAVNVAARLIEHAGDDETLVTDALRETLPPNLQGGFRSLDRLAVRGRSEPVAVSVALRQDAADMPTTHFGDLAAELPRRLWLDLSWHGRRRSFASSQTPVLIGRDPQATCHVDLPTVSRSHARIDWHSGGFQLTDLSFNGTYVHVQGAEPVSLRRGTCTLVGSGSIGLGAPVAGQHGAWLDFRVASDA
ncbi:MAG: FHA domain-containing protein [Rubrivivax sp.]